MYNVIKVINKTVFLNDGYDWIVDIDLEKFFDTVNHDKLMTLISNTYKVKKLNELIRGWINYFKIGAMRSICEKLDCGDRGVSIEFKSLAISCKALYCY